MCTYRWDCGFVVKTVRDFLSDGFYFLWGAGGKVICWRGGRKEGLVGGLVQGEQRFEVVKNRKKS